jgi:hypothetical protein
MELLAVWDGSLRVSGARPRGVDGRVQSQRNSACSSNGNTANEDLLVGTRKLALEETFELCVLGSLLAVRNGHGIGRVARLLSKDLSKFDRVRVVFELLGLVNHCVCRVLLLARSRRGKKRAESLYGDRVAILSTASFPASGLPFGGRSGGVLGDTLLKRSALDRSNKESESNE